MWSNDLIEAFLLAAVAIWNARRRSDQPIHATVRLRLRIDIRHGS